MVYHLQSHKRGKRDLADCSGFSERRSGNFPAQRIILSGFDRKLAF